MAIKTDYITYKQVVEMIRDFADDHREINYFGIGDAWELVESVKNTDTFDYRNYPVLWILPTSVTILDGAIEYDMSVVHASIQFDKDGETIYENNILSDCITRHIDLMAYLKIDPEFKTNEVRIFVGDTSVGEPFTERFDDNLVGYTFSFTLRQKLNLDICSIPK